MNDLDLRDLVLEELEFKPDINAASIGVTVQNGVVTLSGHVKSYAQKVSAERTVKAMKGVRGLAEGIEVRLNKLEKWSSVRPGRCRASARSKIIC